MVEKDKDLFLDMLENPNLTLEDLVSVGHSAESTRFLDKSMYENSQRVRNKFTDSDGNFKQDEFNRWYSVAANAYQDLTNKDTNLSLLNVTAFNESDITVSPEKRTLNTKPIVSFTPNPDRLSTSIFRIGKTSERDRTQSELALAEKVLLNPVEAALDPSKAKWGDSPNDSWWGNFFDTLVLAQWDDDGEHIDPVTKQKVSHKKGELKLNDNGTYYYEALDGRDIYGRLVLNKFNTITTDGSFWNQYDFFDSDDIKEKSFVGSVAKNLALVGSMFIPYVGWGIAGASIATQMLGLAGTFGKMLTGSDSPTFSAMEGWAKSFSRQSAKSEYAQQNLLCWENFIDLIGDTTAQLREQRAIFKFAPALFGKGKYGILSERLGMNTKALKDAEMNTLRKASEANLSKYELARAASKGGGDIKNVLQRGELARENIISQIADKAVADYLSEYNKVGEQLARAYMVGITVLDTYGEAKEAGANDLEAALLTIGYAAAENKLLNSELGRWIFPELKAERASMTLVAKKLTLLPEAVTEKGMKSTLRSSGVELSKAELIGKRIAEMPQDVRDASKALGNLSDNNRLAWMKKWFNAGKEIFDTLKSVMSGTMGAAVSNALAEGVEEVSEELLKDFSTSCFNIVKAALGDKETRMLGFLGEWDWNLALKRYGMSFFGGLVGGGINSAAYDYKNFKDIANMTSEKAMLLLVWMDRNNEMDKFWDIVSKETLGDKYHSSKRNEDGTYQLGDENDNLDLEVKRALRTQIDTIHNILTANGASVDDEGLIGKIMSSLPSDKTLNILGDFRTNALATSVTAGRFLKEYNSLCKAMVIESLKLKELTKQAGDVKENVPDDLQAAIEESKQSLLTLQDAKDKLLSGERSAEFYKDALFETTYGVSESFIAPTEVLFMERYTQKPYSLITKEEKEKLSSMYADWSTSERSEQIHQLADIFFNVAQKTSKALLDSARTYQLVKDGQLEHFDKVTAISHGKLLGIIDTLRYNQEDKLSKIQEIISGMVMDSSGNYADPLGLQQDELGEIITVGGQLSDMLSFLGNESDQFANKIQNIVDDTTLTRDQQAHLMTEAFIENIHKELDKTALEILKVGYVHPEVKRNFIPVLKLTADYCEELSEVLQNVAEVQENEGNLSIADKYMQYYDKMTEISDALNELANQIQELSYTPISQNLKHFAIGLGTDATVLSLVEDAINKEKSYQEAVDNIILNEEQVKLFEEAEKLLKLYRASIVAARNDNADVDHIYGYNKVLNELCGKTENWEPLAEIDANTALLAILDVNMALDRLRAIKGISDLNLGNKLNILNYTAANKSYILYNKTKKLITSLLNEDDDDAKDVRAKWNTNGALDELKLAIDNMQAHRELSGETLSERVLSLNSQQKEAIERELHAMDDALYTFFQKNLDKLANNDLAKSDLALFIKAAKLDLYDKNEDLLTQSSGTIDDGSYIWWLASKAALKGSDFYKEYRKIITDDVAPIPTLELGVFAAIAAIYNGDVFSAFGRAMKKYVYDDWKSKSDAKYNSLGGFDSQDPGEKGAIIKAKGLKGLLPESNEDIKDVNCSDLVPSYYNILFIEGIPGSGKSTGVFKTIVKLLNSLNPYIDDKTRLLDKPIIVSHSNLKNAEDLAGSLGFQDGSKVTAYGKEELLQWISPEYKNREDPDTGRYIYNLGTDCIIDADGNILSNWKVRQLSPEDAPSVMFIDEWSRYTLPEVDLINRFALEYGVLVIAGGDMDLLSPKAYLILQPGTDPEGPENLEMSIARNITPRVPKLGVSMRTGNGQKSLNLHTLQSWKRNKTTDPVDLLYVETDSDLFGDKAYRVTDDLTDKLLEEIKADIDKMVLNLDSENNELIGFIFSNPESKLFKLLSSEPYKGKIDFKSEAAALGREARYYIVENNRSPRLTDDEYLKSLYTGISRAEQASLVIVPQNPIGKLTIRRPKNLENKLIPDNFTADGIARFSKLRKELLNSIYGSDESPDLSKVVSRELIPVILSNVNEGVGGTISEVDALEVQPRLGQNEGPLEGTPEVQVLGVAINLLLQGLATDSAQPQNIAFPKGSIIDNGQISAIILDVVQTNTEELGLQTFYKVDLGLGVGIHPELQLLDMGYLILNIELLPPLLEIVPISAGSNPGSNAAAARTNLTLHEASTNDPALLPIPFEPTLENIEKLLNTIALTAQLFNNGKLKFNIVYLELALSASRSDLSKILTNLVNQNAIESESGGYYSISPDVLNLLIRLILEKKNPNGSELNEGLNENEEDPSDQPSSAPLYKVGDKFKLGPIGDIFIVKSINIDPDSLSISYTLIRGTLESIKSEESLKLLESLGRFKAREEEITPGGAYRLPELPSTAQGKEHLQLLIEEDAEVSEQPVIELAKKGENDISYTILGHTWNTNYLGVQFDPDSGLPILPLEGEPGSKRIDLANGLVKLDPIKFSSEKACRLAIGTIRKSMMFDSNERIAQVILNVIPTLQNLELKIEWAFISKSKLHNTGDGGRFFYDPLYRLENMEDFEHSEIPIKTISMLVLDEAGNCVLEMPILTLGSPFTALYQLGLQSPTNEIFLVYDAASRNPNMTEQQILLTVIDAINSSAVTKNEDGHISSGYKRLLDICKLWLFTNDGVRLIPKRGKNKFNLHEHTKNLGSHYVKNRVTEHTIRGKQNPYDYTMLWHDMTMEGMRTDVNYSDILLATSEFDENFNRIVAAGHPFVLRSDSDAFVTTLDMMDRYLAQQSDPSLEKIVKLEILTPPEISVSEYLIERAKDRGCNYGNEFSAYRILSIIKKTDPLLWRELEFATKSIVSPIIDRLDEIQNSLLLEANENHLEFMSRVYFEQKLAMIDLKAIHSLSDALFELTWDYNGNKFNTKEVKYDVINRIQKLCDKINPETGKKFLTGVLHRPVCVKELDPVSGFALRVQTGQNRFTSPDGKPYRIYSRYETPIFDISSLAGAISNWASSAKQGFTAADGTNYPNIWRFDDRGRKDYALAFYTAEGNSKKPKTKTLNLKLKEKHSKLLEKLELKDYDRLDNVNDEAEFLEIIKDKYIETPGNVAIVVNGKKLIYTNLSNAGVNGTYKFPEEFAQATQESFVSNNAGDNSYTLTLKIGNDVSEINVEVVEGNSELIFDLGKPEVPETPTVNTSVPLFDFSPALTALDNKISKTAAPNVRKKYESWKKIITDGISLGKSRSEIAEQLLKGLKPLDKNVLKAIVGKEFFLEDEIIQDQASLIVEDENAVCSITVHKKFVK